MKYLKSLLLKTTPANLRILVEKERSLTYNTRNQADSLRLYEYPYKKTKLKNQSLSKSIFYWNDLTPDIKELSKKDFEKTLKKQMIDKY